MIAIIGLFIILILALTVVRIGAIALELTGLSTDIAAFQAQSAFSGAGFTTSESETIVSHPVRRKIIRVLILLGSAGITSTIATLIAAFIGLNSQNLSLRVSVLALGLCVIYFLSWSTVIYKGMKRIIVKSLSRVKALRILDYHELLGIGQGYSISRFVVKENNWMIGQMLKKLELGKEGTLILSIYRNSMGNEKVIIPTADTVIEGGDRLTLYGKCASCQCLSERPKGDKGKEAHQKRVEIQKAQEKIQSVTDGMAEQ